MKDFLRPAAPALLVALTGLTHIPAAHARAMIDLTANAETQGSAPDVALTWTGATPNAHYIVYRDTKTLSQVTGGAYTDTGVHSGETHRYFVVEVSPRTDISNTVTVHVPAPTPTLPAAPTGLTASGVWDTTRSLPTVQLAWGATTGATGYKVYRNGTLLQSGLTGPAFSDATVASGQAYAYAVSAVGPGGEGTKSAAVTVAAPAPPPPAAPTGLTASGVWDTTRSLPTVQLAWGATTGATGYKVYRNGTLLQSGLTGPAFSDATVASGQTYAYAVSAVGPGGDSAQSNQATATAPNPPPPVAPTGLTASGVWDPDCVECNNMAMPEVDMSWQASPGATGYKVYRNGTLLQSGLTAATFEDMTVASGQTYAYAVAATGPGGDSAQSNQATATAPNPPPTATGTALIAPANVCDRPFYLGGSNDVLSWDPVPGAVSYHVYQYDTLLASVTSGTSYTVTPAQSIYGVSYTVTAVDATGMESMPSAEMTASGQFSLTNEPGWLPASWNPGAPARVIATPEWNNGAPRIALTWCYSGEFYNVYRDGHLLASGLWGLAYYDSQVNPGESHTYSVTGYYPYIANSETPHSPSVTATALSGAPASLPGKLQILKVVSNSNSVKVFFNTVPGAVDYRLYNVASPGTVKYAGRNEAYQNGDMVKNNITPIPALTTLCIEMNGINPVSGATLVLQAVDKLGPFQKMDGATGPGGMPMAGMVNSSINGQGDPSNVPNVLAQSDPLPVTCVSHALTGDQAFFDDFQSPTPLTPVTTLSPALAAINAAGHPIQEQENDKWRIRTYDADNVMTKAFFMGSHFMDTLYDGPFALHNNNSSLVMIPKATGDISGGRVLHVTFEVDAHMDGRRWCDLQVVPAGDDLLTSVSPDKLGTGTLPTTSGNQFVWEVTQGGDTATLVEPSSPGATTTTQTDVINKVWGDLSYERDEYKQVWQGVPYANGSACRLDNRSRFDLYLSRNHYRFVETQPDGVTQIVCDKDFPAGMTLPFSNCQVYFVHELYHTSNDRPETVSGSYNDCYWYNYRPWSDERHWDNMGFEVLPSFPALGGIGN